MSLPRITQHQADAVARLKAEGKRPRQIETMLGLTYGILSGRYVVGEDARPIMDRSPYGNGWRYPTPPQTSGDAPEPEKMPPPAPPPRRPRGDP